MEVDQALAESLGVGDSVTIHVRDVILTGSLTAVSSVPGANLLSTVRISVANGQKYIGQTATIIFPVLGAVSENKVLLPIDAIRIISEGQGEVAILTPEKQIVRKTVSIVHLG